LQLFGPFGFGFFHPFNSSSFLWPFDSSLFVPACLRNTFVSPLAFVSCLWLLLIIVCFAMGEDNLFVS